MLTNLIDISFLFYSLYKSIEVPLRLKLFGRLFLVAFKISCCSTVSHLAVIMNTSIRHSSLACQPYLWAIIVIRSSHRHNVRYMRPVRSLQMTPTTTSTLNSMQSLESFSFQENLTTVARTLGYKQHSIITVRLDVSVIESR